MQTEPVQPVAAREPRLRAQRLDHSKVVKTQRAGQTRLVMAHELGQSARDVCPLREALAPPAVVLRYRMKLWQIERNELDGRLAWARVAWHGGFVSRTWREIGAK